MDNAFLAIALLALSTVLIIAEIFIPSGGMLAMGTFGALAASFYFAWLAWWQLHPVYFFSFTGFAIVFLPTVIVSSFAILPYTPMGKRILLAGPSEEEVIPFAAEEEHLRGYLKQFAKTVTPLTPNGFIEIDGERINASSEGVIVDSGSTVQIIKVAGTRVVVREAQPREQNDLAVAGEEKQPDESTLDFDIPETET
ncbi:MAG: hypothetical protein KDA78_03700 [Planctomycetaceae bacterium]|nr:hypothetical protein [Planctomycetaceae bacterium]